VVSISVNKHRLHDQRSSRDWHHGNERTNDHDGLPLSQQLNAIDAVVAHRNITS